MRRTREREQQQVSSTCEALRPLYKTKADFLKYKETGFDIAELETYVGGILASDLQNQGPPEQQAAMQARIRENLGTLTVFEDRVKAFLKCVQNDIIAQQRYSGKIYNLQSEVRDKQKSVNEMEQTAQEAKERAKFLEDPYAKTTRWESWFPLGRPLQKESLPVLLSIALLFCVLSLGMFLRLAQIELKLSWGGDFGSSYLSGYGIGR